jgi:hypothetical protein
MWLGEFCVGVVELDREWHGASLLAATGTITFGCRGKVSARELVGVWRDLQMEGIRGHDARCNAVVVLETDIGA